MSIAIRPARLEDAEAVVRVHEEASADSFDELVGKSFGEVFPFAGRLHDCRVRLASGPDEGGTLVAESAGEIVGMAVWRRELGGDGELEDLHVVPAAWGTGAATSLIEAAADALRRAGVAAPFLWVGEANARARRFYEREGWTDDGASRPSLLGPIELRYRLSGGQPGEST